ncbi:hypothetical protein [Croceicoccus sediminis]|uniref:hypothetical protein n=1 Tax=Croceicoccus sediminis TaxID=2571150 RepID=UPI001183610B|nr:hypothetical protein [Croceicoccus sediminis]
MNSDRPDLRAHELRTMYDALDAFWQDAGVDMAFADEPRDWLAEAEEKANPSAPTIPKMPPPPPPKPLGPTAPEQERLEDKKDGWPHRLDDFAGWWLSDASLDNAPAVRRVPPRGASRPPLMVIVAEPEETDRDLLLSGPDGQLMDAIERAMGYEPQAIYRASALPRRTPAADWEGLAAAGMGAVLRHHVSLVAPERLLVLSREALTLLSPDEFARDGTGFLGVGERQIPLIAAYPLDQMAARTGYKRIFWQRWLAFISDS